jgi:hypothetical protein
LAGGARRAALDGARVARARLAGVIVAAAAALERLVVRLVGAWIQFRLGHASVGRARRRQEVLGAPGLVIVSGRLRHDVGRRAGVTAVDGSERSLARP